MPKSSNRRGLGRSTGTVTVIEARVHRNYARNARVTFYLTGILVALLTATVAADYTHPILAALIGILAGVIVGALAYAAVRSWPVVRWLWWWTPEILSGLAAVYGFTALARHTTLPLRLAVLALIVGVPAAIPTIRRRTTALAWCVIVRHRLRVCFHQFIIANRSGSLPLILWATPTPVGERVHVYLRPGLALADLEHRLDKIAVACHATAVTVDKASDRTAAHIRIDIKRREALTATVGSPLVDLVDPTTPPPARAPGLLPTALDLPDIPTGNRTPANSRPGNGKPARIDGAKPSPRRTTPTSPATPANATPATAVITADGDDVTDWI